MIIAFILTAGLQLSGWKEVNEKHKFVFVSKRPDLVRSLTLGGLNGYSFGSNSTPWYHPF